MRNIYKYFFSLIGLFLVCITVKADTKEEMPIFNGVYLKIDLLNPVLELTNTTRNSYSYELNTSVNLLNRYFPTIEFGVAGAQKTTANESTFSGNGSFLRIGADVSMTKKKKDTKGSYFLGGARIGMAMQNYNIENLSITDNYWQTTQTLSYNQIYRVDAWAEVVGGVQVSITSRIQMGWAIRGKFLLTRNNKINGPTAWYIPGFGPKKESTFGFNYYIGYKF